MLQSRAPAPCRRRRVNAHPPRVHLVVRRLPDALGRGRRGYTSAGRRIVSTIVHSAPPAARTIAVALAAAGRTATAGTEATRRADMVVVVWVRSDCARRRAEEQPLPPPSHASPTLCRRCWRPCPPARHAPRHAPPQPRAAPPVSDSHQVRPSPPAPPPRPPQPLLLQNRLDSRRQSRARRGMRADAGHDSQVAAFAAAAAARPLWLPGGKAPAHLTGTLPGDYG